MSHSDAVFTVCFILLYLTWPVALLWLVVWVVGKAWKAAKD